MKLLVAVKTCHKLDYFVDDQTTDWLNAKGLRFLDASARVAAQRATWLSEVPEGVDYKFFYGTTFRRTDVKPNQRPGTAPPLPPLRGSLSDEVFLPVGDNYTHNSAKVKAICKYALDGGYDYILLVDDDTFVYLDRILQTDFNEYDYSGAPTETFHPGSCIFLSRSAMNVVVASRITNYADDLWIGEALNAAGIPTHNLPNVRHGVGENYPIRHVSPSLVEAYAALHSCNPSVMEKLWTLRTTASSELPKDTVGTPSEPTQSVSLLPGFEAEKSSLLATSLKSLVPLSDDLDLNSSITPAQPETQSTNGSVYFATGLIEKSLVSDSSSTVTSETL